MLFNRFFQPDIDPEPGRRARRGPVEPERGPPAADLDRDPAPAGRASLAATTGVDAAADVIKYLLAGADVVMTTQRCSGMAPACGRLLDGLSGWMVRKGYASVSELRGVLAVPAEADQARYERAGYVAAMRVANNAPGPW